MHRSQQRMVCRTLSVSLCHGSGFNYSVLILSEAETEMYGYYQGLFITPRWCFFNFIANQQRCLEWLQFHMQHFTSLQRTTEQRS